MQRIEGDGEWEWERLLAEWVKSGHPRLRKKKRIKTGLMMMMIDDRTLPLYVKSPINTLVLLCYLAKLIFTLYSLVQDNQRQTGKSVTLGFH